ncbi:hypothetical protein [Collinsella intestinalis]|uniref:Uncharacterized protein n=1 Tax=Collinsella intestinalis DSM 13280 TaxID=521003 RepID=C4FAN3_9ACTN|nr:hypothetical protein [Collinsella intestinalis]EEP44167.1 hypothetical protein COLINT_03128 [Collinsella intestinalis DSM 13280]
MKHMRLISQELGGGSVVQPLSFDCALGVTDFCKFQDHADGCALTDYCDYDKDHGSICVIDHCGIDQT